MATKVPKAKKEAFHPDYDTLLLKEVIAKERLSSGGIFIPETVDENKDQDVNHGEIIEIGPSSKPDRPFLWETGDVVVFGVYNARRIEFNGDTFLLVRHMDVLGAIN